MIVNHMNYFARNHQIPDCIYRYAIEVTELYYWKFLLQPGLLVYSVAISIFLYMKANFDFSIIRITIKKKTFFFK